MDTAAPTISAPSFAEAQGRDFADWISPILVKELRQGLKTRMFVMAFVAVQLVMTLLLGLRILVQEAGDDSFTSPLFDGLLWTALGILMLVIMPLRGLSSISEETKANTLDLLALTRMGSFRIVFGKWLALVVQTLLLTVAVLPYAVLRYFFGRVDVVGDLQMLGLMLLGSAVLTAGCVYLSTTAQWVKSLALALAVPFLWMLMAALLSGVWFGGGSYSLALMGGATFWLTLIAAIYTVFFLLEATARISPIAQQHPLTRRLLALGVASISAAITLIGDKEATIAGIVVAAPLVSAAVVMALCELTSTLPIVYVPLERLGILGRALGLVLHPGWATGLVFAAVAVGLLGVALSTAGSGWLLVWMVYLAVVAPVIPLALAPQIKSRIGLYVLCHLLMLLWSLVVSIGSGRQVILQALFPTSALADLMGHGDSTEMLRVFAPISMLSGGLIMVILALLWRREIAVMWKLQAAAREMLQPKPTASTP